MLDRFGLLFLFYAVLGWGKNLFGTYFHTPPLDDA